MSYTYLIDMECVTHVLCTHENKKLYSLHEDVRSEEKRAEVLFSFVCECNTREIRKEIRNWSSSWMDLQKDAGQGWILKGLCRIAPILRRAISDTGTRYGDGDIYWEKNKEDGMRTPYRREPSEQRIGESLPDVEIGALETAWSKFVAEKGQEWTLCVNFICSPEQGEESLAESFSDIPQFVLSRLNLTAEKSSSNGSETEFCHTSRYGTTCEPSTESRGAEKSISYAVDSPAKTCPSLEKGKDYPVSAADSGRKWPESLARYDRDSRLWRTAQLSLFGGLGESLETWPNWGTTAGMEYWEGSPPGDVLTASACGLSLMRPIATEARRHALRLSSMVRKNHQDGNLSEQLARVHRKMPTPLACEILMGWPERWTECEPLEMGSVQDWLRSHGKPWQTNKGCE